MPDKPKTKTNTTAQLAKNPLAERLIEKLMYEALQPLVDTKEVKLHIAVGRRNLAIELLTEMEVIK